MSSPTIKRTVRLHELCYADSQLIQLGDAGAQLIQRGRESLLAKPFSGMYPALQARNPPPGGYGGTGVVGRG